MTVDIFIPCFIDQVYPDTGFSMVKILEKIGMKVKYNTEQTCCGQPAFNSGYWDEARKVARKFIMDFPYDRPIISPSASCTAFVKNHYSELMENSDSLYDHDKISKNLFELTDFLVNKMKITNLGARFKAKVTVHDSCAALREYGLTHEPRTLLKNVEGLEIIEMQDPDTCCGFGGTFAIKYEPISTAMAQQKIENAINSGAEYIVSTEGSCLMQLDGYIKKNNLPIKTIHIADILASGY
ncbi:MAG: Fe-S oxidoreductase [Marinilabiliales bacterium]|nr:MAG: Fe-S oxidoreductase [Marinilabiliales bacterium]